MIDTITLTLSDIRKHHLLYSCLLTINSGYRIQDVERRGGSTLHREVHINDETMLQKDRFIFRTRNQPSSHYKVIFTADKHKDIITFSFSIPKYFYGHNVVQAVCNSNESDFSLTRFSIEDQLEIGFNRLYKYINQFFLNEFPGCPIDWRCVQIKRLDFCFNQIFKTKEAALEYLEVQKNMKKKYLRENSTHSNNYKTSIFYANDDYSVKIYHKGTEFEKDDKRELERINRDKKFDYFNTQYLQNFSDSILRYEITLRPSYMSYIYNSKIFRKESKQFKTWKKIYTDVKNVKVKLEKKKIFDEFTKVSLFMEIYKKYQNKVDKETGLKLLPMLRKMYYKNKEYNGKESSSEIISLLSKFYNDMDNLLTTRRKFYIKLFDNDKILHFNDNSSNRSKFETVKIVPFTNELYKLMAKKLYEFIDDISIQKKLVLSEYLKRIDDYNDKINMYNKKTKDWAKFSVKKAEKKLHKDKLALLISALETYDLDYLQKIIGFSRSTLQRYKSDLKKIGYTKNTVGNLGLENPEINFKTYFEESVLNQNKMFVNQLFIWNI